MFDTGTIIGREEDTTELEKAMDALDEAAYSADFCKNLTIKG